MTPEPNPQPCLICGRLVHVGPYASGNGKPLRIRWGDKTDVFGFMCDRCLRLKTFQDNNTRSAVFLTEEERREIGL